MITVCHSIRLLTNLLSKANIIDNGVSIYNCVLRAVTMICCSKILSINNTAATCIIFSLGVEEFSIEIELLDQFIDLF